jgi:hypothetical protein
VSWFCALLCDSSDLPDHFNSLFQLVLAFDATVNRNTIQIIGLSVFNALFLAYAVIQVGP